MGERRFQGDPRYDLQNVTDGFASRLESRTHDQADDKALLERICTAYIRATEQQSVIKSAYGATSWWQSNKPNLLSVQRALAERDTDTLRTMYRNFFRDPCSAGLVGVPYGLGRNYNGEGGKDLYRRFFLSDALHRIDYWKKQTGGRFGLRDLFGPGIGSPFGVLIDGTLIGTGAAYQHYCAQRIYEILSAESETFESTTIENATIVEIGGGFGSMAYYLLRDRPKFTYINFDVPETLALAAYYLLKSFPYFRLLLYGEEELNQESTARFNVILMPAHELSKVPINSADLTFSAHAMSSLSDDAMVEYMKQVDRMTRQFFLYIHDGAAGGSLQEMIRLKHPAFKLVERRFLEWNTQLYINSTEVESLFQKQPI